MDPVRTSAGRLLTAEDVVERLLKYPDLRESASNCVLPAIRVGSEWRFREEDLEAWIASQTES
jgi:excisionase family DNA binding protein